LIYAAGLGIGLLLEWLFPIRNFGSPLVILGIVLALAGLTLGGWFVISFRRAGTAIDPYHPSTALVTSGPFRFSRNPGYLSMATMFVGIALALNAIWPFLFLPVVLVIVQRGVIEREERYLESTFGDAYRKYKAHTRRWI
jgi:protein-S-isoprenylcysteine O-methyltransferase Ste14